MTYYAVNEQGPGEERAQWSGHSDRSREEALAYVRERQALDRAWSRVGWRYSIEEVGQ